MAPTSFRSIAKRTMPGVHQIGKGRDARIRDQIMRRTRMRLRRIDAIWLPTLQYRP